MELITQARDSDNHPPAYCSPSGVPSVSHRATSLTASSLPHRSLSGCDPPTAFSSPVPQISGPLDFSKADADGLVLNSSSLSENPIVADFRAALIMSNIDITNDGLVGLDYDSRGYLHAQSWPVAVDQNGQRADGRRDISPLQTSGHVFDQTVSHDPNLISDWQFQQQLQSHLQYSQVETPSAPQFTSSFGVPLQASPVDLMPASQAPLDTSTLLDGSYLSLSAPVDIMPFTYHDFHDLMAFPNGLPDMTAYGAPHNIPESSSPTDTYLEVRSLTSASSDNGWATVETRRSIDPSFPEHGLFINPAQTLHDRTLSESSYSASYSDFENHPRASWGSFVDISNPMNSPGSESNLESVYNSSMDRRVSLDHTSHGSVSPTAVSPVAIVRPIPVPVKKSSSPTRSSTSQSSSASPPSRKPSRKSPIAAKTSETKVRKQSQSGKPETTEKKIGKRKGPLKPDQRKQASEIRKLRACLRCKFLKKTVCFRWIPRCILNFNSFTHNENSAIKVNPVLAVSLHMPGCGRFRVPESISKRLGIS
jgi:hypothetical protein